MRRLAAALTSLAGLIILVAPAGATVSPPTPKPGCTIESKLTLDNQYPGKKYVKVYLREMGGKTDAGRYVQAVASVRPKIHGIALCDGAVGVDYRGSRQWRLMSLKGPRRMTSKVFFLKQGAFAGIIVHARRV